MTLEIVREHAQGASRATDFAQRLVQLLDLRGVRPGQIAGVVEGALRARQRAARACQGQIEIDDCFVQVVADLLQWHLVELVEDVLDGRLGIRELPRSGWQPHRTLRPVHRRLGSAGKNVERYIRRPGQQVTGPELRADSMRHQRVDQLPARGLQVRAGPQIKDFDPESLWVQAYQYRHRE